MNLKKNCLFVFFVCLFSFFKEVLAIHHHPRLPINYLENSIFFGEKRVVFMNISKSEALKLKKEIKQKKCEVENRKIVFLYKKNNEYYYLKNDQKESSLTYILPSKVSIVGLDGFLKFSNNEIQSLDQYFTFIDKMPLRKKEKQFDKTCN